MDLCSVVPNSTSPLLIVSQFVNHQQVKIFISLTPTLFIYVKWFWRMIMFCDKLLRCYVHISGVTTLTKGVLYRVLHKQHYYSFKIFSRFWLVKTTRTIHHNQLLFTKFGEKSSQILNQWRQRFSPPKTIVQPAADYWTADRENLGTRLCYIWWAEKQRA